MFKTILAAVDGSEPSTHALHVAAQLAKEQAAQLHIITAVPPLPAIAMEGFSPSYLPEYMDDLEEAMQQVLDKAAEDVKKTHPKLKVTTHLKDGRPAKQITDTAAEVDADLIVMGSRGQSGILSWVLGSTAREVADSCTAPVLVVKDRRYCQA
jgi:nucleotide-binding universal stress UspA family protein